MTARTRSVTLRPMSNRRFTKRKAATTNLTPEQKQLELLRKQAAARLLKRRRRKSHQ
jgi:hypothetical protein